MISLLARGLVAVDDGTIVFVFECVWSLSHTLPYILCSNMLSVDAPRPGPIVDVDAHTPNARTHVATNRASTKKHAEFGKQSDPLLPSSSLTHSIASATINQSESAHTRHQRCPRKRKDTQARATNTNRSIDLPLSLAPQQPPVCPAAPHSQLYIASARFISSNPALDQNLAKGKRE